MILLNTLLFPRLMRQEITQVDYGTFLTMLKDKEVAVAQVLLSNKNIGNLVVQKESGDPIRRML